SGRFRERSAAAGAYSLVKREVQSRIPVQERRSRTFRGHRAPPAGRSFPMFQWLPRLFTPSCSPAAARGPPCAGPRAAALAGRYALPAGIGPSTLLAGGDYTALRVDDAAHLLQYLGAKGWQDVKAFAGKPAWKVAAVSDTDSIAVFVNERSNGRLWEI